jgi:hypothetical protein
VTTLLNGILRRTVDDDDDDDDDVVVVDDVEVGGEVDDVSDDVEDVVDGAIAADDAAIVNYLFIDQLKASSFALMMIL